jgi:ankyrin repeat protein
MTLDEAYSHRFVDGVHLFVPVSMGTRLTNLEPGSDTHAVLQFAWEAEESLQRAMRGEEPPEVVDRVLRVFPGRAMMWSGSRLLADALERHNERVVDIILRVVPTLLYDEIPQRVVNAYRQSVIPISPLEMWKTETLLRNPLSNPTPDTTYTRILQQYPKRVYRRDQVGRTLLHSFAYAGRAELVSFLLTTAPQLVRTRSRAEFSTALHDACKSSSAGALDTVNLLLGHWSAAAREANHSGRLPLHNAAKNDPLVLQAVLAAFPDGTRAVDIDHHTPLYDAIVSKRTRNIRILVRADPEGALNPPPLVEDPLPLAIRVGSFNAVRALLSILPQLARRPTEIGAGEQPLHPLSLALGLMMRDTCPARERIARFVAKHDPVQASNELTRLDAENCHPGDDRVTQAVALLRAALTGPQGE